MSRKVKLESIPVYSIEVAVDRDAGVKRKRERERERENLREDAG